MLAEDFNAAVSEERAAWDECENASLDRRIAERSGDRAEIEKARKNEIEAARKWASLHHSIEAVKVTFFRSLGLSNQAIAKLIK